MSITERLPGMRPGHTTRNVFVALFYPTAAALLFLASPLLIAAATARDYRGTAGRLERLPGITSSGGLQAGAVAGCYTLVVVALVVSASGTDSTQSPPPQVDHASPPPTITTTAPATPTAAPPATTAASTTARPTTTTTATPTPTPTTTAAPTTTGQTTTRTTTSSTPAGAGTVTVTRIVDGDTIEIAYENGTQDTVRLLGVDTPEVHTSVAPDEFEGVPDTDAGRACLEAEGEDASEQTKRVLSGATVTLRFDENADRRGYYGRLLAYVITTDGENYNYQLIEQGFARVYEGPFTQESRFLDGENAAQAANSGVWRCQQVTTTTTTTSSAGGSGFSVSVHEDARGDEYDNLDDEYVTLTNGGTTAVDLSGWTIEDAANHAYTVPGGVTLDAGGSITLYTGSGTDSSSELYWGQDAPVWNNGGDTVTVRDASGEIVVEESYS